MIVATFLAFILLFQSPVPNTIKKTQAKSKPMVTETRPVVTEHSVTVNGRTLNYNVTTGFSCR